MFSETPNVATRVIAFLASLYGNHPHSIDGRSAFIDLLTGVAYVQNPDDDEGEMLTMIAPGGGIISTMVLTHKIVETYTVRHAQAMVIADGGSARAQYEMIQNHFDVKTSA